MTLPYKGTARIPGPLGGTSNSGRGRAPGPVGGVLWDKKTNTPPQAAVKAAAKKTGMPAPTSDQDSRDVHVVPWPLFGPKSPAVEDIQQAPGLANCPVASILAALAFTAGGRNYLHKLVSETAAAAITDLSSLKSSQLANPPASMTVSSSRYFTVKLPGGRDVEVSDVLYTNDADRNWSVFYLRDPRERALWGPVIEKALAVRLGGYENFDALNLSANDFFEKITGAKPGGFPIKADTPLSEIIDAAKAATRVSTIGASKPDSSDVKVVSEFHGHAMLGMEGAKIRLYDPAKAKVLTISPADFKHDFQAILFWK